MKKPPAFAHEWKWWCESCGSLTNDGECDCTKFEHTMASQKLRRAAYIDWYEEDKRK